MMKFSTQVLVLAALAGLLGFSAPGAAQTPAAVVEGVQGKVTGAEFMDYVSQGNVIKLGPQASVVLGYMKSCRRETITGVGVVIVGTDQSMVHEADVKSAQVRCASDHSHAVGQEVVESAATSFRGLDVPSAPAPKLVLYGSSPVFETAGRGKLVVERVDVKGERYEVDLVPNALAKGRFYDFAKSGNALKAGGTYLASLGSQRILFRIDRGAEPGPTPVIGRLIRLH